jgi:hypothetical protein
LSPPGYMSKAQAIRRATARGVGWRSLDRLLNSGRLPALVVGNRIHVREIDLEQALLPQAIPLRTPRKPKRRKQPRQLFRVPESDP